MTDASALATTPAPAGGSTTPAAGDLLKPLDAATAPTTPEDWERRRVDLIGDPHFRKAYLSGDVSAQAKMKEVLSATNPKVDEATQEGREYAARQAILTPLKMVAGSLPAEFWDAISRKSPVTLAEREWALRMRASCLADRSWGQKALSGDMEASALKVKLSAILGSRVGSAEEVARYRDAGQKFLNGGTK